jgi:predicted membrane metal-binding protein
MSSEKNEAVAGRPPIVARDFFMKTPMWTVRLVGYGVLFFIAAVIVAVLTPTPDAISMAFSWLIASAVFCGLFELGWLLYRRNKE